MTVCRTALLLGALAACATPETRQDVPALRPFLAAGRFVPKGMTSFACEHELIPLTDLATECVVTAGRDFESPEDLGIGVSRTIWIADVGVRGGADAGLRSSLAEWATKEFVIGSTRCWHATPERNRYDMELWCAVVEDRFVLVALKRDVLVDALAGATDLATELAPFGDLSVVAADTTELMFLLPRPGQAPTGMESPDGPIVCAIQSSPWRLTMFSREPLPVPYGELLVKVCSSTEGPSRSGDWNVLRGQLEEQLSLAESSTLLLSWLWLFGHQIFI
ncbi:MAG: hypothetical protein JNK78_09855 [Planctomycetes bacterium]|nr:hypothetical protein [Planctomycetota bacterium]